MDAMFILLSTFLAFFGALLGSYFSYELEKLWMERRETPNVATFEHDELTWNVLIKHVVVLNDDA